MTKEALKLALEALYALAAMNHTTQQMKSNAITAIKEALAQPERPQNCGTGYCSCIECVMEPEPVAWLHTKIEGVAVPHRPADLDKHPDRWTPLYKEPKPCPTCEALARTVMLDQTSHDTTPPQRTWVGLDNDDLVWIYSNSDKVGQAISNTEAKLKDKNGA